MDILKDRKDNYMALNEIIQNYRVYPNLEHSYK